MRSEVKFTMFYERVNKALNGLIKIASLIITASLTWLVAARVFADIEIVALRFVMQAVAVGLVEFVFLSDWLLLEHDKSAPTEDQDILRPNSGKSLCRALGSGVESWRRADRCYLSCLSRCSACASHGGVRADITATEDEPNHPFAEHYLTLTILVSVYNSTIPYLA